MADKKKASGAKVTTKVVATTDAPKKTKKRTQKTSVAASKKPVTTGKTTGKKTKQKKQRDNYFVGAWRELKQVRWPSRKDTWSLTFAVIVYSIFFFVLIILLDALFKYLFDLVIGG